MEKAKFERINAALDGIGDATDALRKARSEGWNAVAEFLADGPVTAELPDRYKQRIQEELEKIPDGLEREAMATAGGPGYLDALRAESFEIPYEGGEGVIESVRMDDGLKVVLLDSFNGTRATVGIDSIVETVESVLMFIQRFAR